MREREMRERVERFLQTRLRKMLMPATVGLGLGLGLVAGACNSDALDANDDGGRLAKKDVAADKQILPPFKDAAGTDTGSTGMLYMAQMPDAGSTPDSGVAVRYGAQVPADAASDSSRIVALYMAQLPVPRT